MSYGFKIIVEGDYALFTRPEFKVERVSYDVPTPGALEGMLKSIYWKPAIRYVIDKIVIFNKIQFENIRRNEVKDKISLQKVKGQMKHNEKDPSLYTSEIRSQRASMLLKNVKYGIEFHFELTYIKSDQEEADSEKKHYNIIKRRLEKGQQYRTPCFGCTELPVKKIVMVDDFNYDEIDEEIRTQEDTDLGFMLYRVQFKDHGIPKNNDWENPVFSDEASSLYYRPHIKKGIIDVAQYREELRC